MTSVIKLFDWEALEAMCLCYWPLFLFLLLIIAGSCCKTWPTGRAFVFFLLPVFLSAVFAFFDAETGRIFIQVADLTAFGVIFADFCSVFHFNSFQVERKTDLTASLGKKHFVYLRIENQGNSRREFFLADDVQEKLNNMEGRFDKKEILPAKESLNFEYSFTPLSRGAFKMEKIWIRVFSLFKCWKKDLVLSVESKINVYPDLHQISQYELLARKQKLYQIGLRTTRFIGQDNDFERLRDYTQDDQYKFIDWKATARRTKLTVKDFQMNRSQRLVFMIDSGRLMMNKTQGFSFLDHAFNSMLLLAHIALKQGDEVGFMTFSEEIRRYLAPRSGSSYLNHLVHGSFDIFPESVESRYDVAFDYLERNCRKRSLIVLITNIIDERNSTQIESHLKNLTGRHLPIGVFLRDHALFDPLRKLSEERLVNRDRSKPESAKVMKLEKDLMVELNKRSDKEIFQAGASAQILYWRSKVIQSLNSGGALTLDLFPENLTAPLINKYLEIKAKHLL